MYYNLVLLSGRLTKDPETTYTTTGKIQSKFNLAYNEKWGHDEKAYFFHIYAYGRTAEFITKYFHKGDKIFLEGKLVQDIWGEGEEKKEFIKVVAFKASFVDSKKQEEKATQETESQPEDNIPF